MKFTELGLSPKILKALESFNFETTTQVQEETIPLILEGKDVTVRSQTGSGKTLAYALPILQNTSEIAENIETLIICPTRELCLQVTDEIKKIVGFLESIKVVPVYGGSAIERQIQALKRRPQIIVGTPGRIMDHMGRRTIKIETLKTLVLDEADEMLNMGFKEDIEKILKSTPKTRQTLLFSATYPEQIRQITKNYQNNPIKIEIGVENRSLKSLTQYYVIVNKNSKKEALLEILNEKKPKIAIVFSNTKRMADIIANYLNENSHNSEALHGDLKQSQRKKVIDRVKRGETEILVASDVAARGLDINDVEYVINFDVPLNVENFIHRIGRTARIGKNGNSMTIIASNLQLKSLKDYERQTDSNIQEMQLSITEKAGSSSQIEVKKSTRSGGFSRGRQGVSQSRGSRSFSERRPMNRDKSSTQRTDRGFSSKENGDSNGQKRRFDRNKNFSNGRNSRAFTRDDNEENEIRSNNQERSFFEKNFENKKEKPRFEKTDKKPFSKFSDKRNNKDFSNSSKKSNFSKPYEKKPYKAKPFSSNTK
ncbi:MAG: DEAD/DEAH box helicase [Clostridia bacterium]|nr:DEAD/DEAH box helicase [Clostridia bacterium]